MRTLFAVLVVVLLLFTLSRLPYPGAPKMPAAPKPAPAVAAAPAEEPAPPPAPKYVTTRECAHGYFGSRSCKEVTTVKP
ncbi:hypothetical protein A33M_0394 [Rhodovulum sp. PH10]|uniref:hypothetical protein n=1 Tax=Rhodovulum sp. PH10 TaxID=1187851 RepID=UPI00027C26D1|nr:hypothetical protein [Rhodovulum sp. PH10]EJW10145.1 hypothetical protein A33M_0394 [Rhodovulum sp. PH10]